MSAYHSKGKTGRVNVKEQAARTPISREAALRLEAMRQRTKDGLALRFRTPCRVCDDWRAARAATCGRGQVP